MEKVKCLTLFQILFKIKENGSRIFQVIISAKAMTLILCRTFYCNTIR